MNFSPRNQVKYKTQQSKKNLELKAWLDDFDIIEKVALYDKPQLLEVLGIFVRS